MERLTACCLTSSILDIAPRSCHCRRHDKRLRDGIAESSIRYYDRVSTIEAESVDRRWRVERMDCGERRVERMDGGVECGRVITHLQLSGS